MAQQTTDETFAVTIEGERYTVTAVDEEDARHRAATQHRATLSGPDVGISVQEYAVMAEVETGAEPVNTSVQQVPVPDVYLYQYGGGQYTSETTHIINGTKYARSRWRGPGTATPMCGGVDVPVGADGDLPDKVVHYADTLDREDIMDDPEGVMSLAHIDVCQRCRISYGLDGVPEDVNVVVLDLDNGEWSR